jgi:hypothetical protein
MSKKTKIIGAILGILSIAAIAWAGTISQQPNGIATPKWYGYSSGAPASYYLAMPTLSANDTACGIAATQTLTNKTLTAPTITGAAIARTNLAEDALQAYGIPINRIMAADGAALPVSESAGDHFLSLGTNTINLEGEESQNETEASASYFQFILPPEYVAAGDVKIRIRCELKGDGTNNGSTVDISAYEQADGAVGSDICATAAATFAATKTWYDKDFTITATNLVAGDVINVKLTSSVIESANASPLAFFAEPPKVLLDIKG